MAFVVSHRDRFLMRQRPMGVVNHGLWEFPNVEITSGETEQPGEMARKLLDVSLVSPESLCTIRHSITRYRIAVDVFRGRVMNKGKSGQWLTLREIDTRALTSAHRKIFNRIANNKS
jgi:adenine-specific DNA glycosylase